MIHYKKKEYLTSILLIGLMLFSRGISTAQETSKPAVVISKDLKWSERMALSIMKRDPKAWQIDNGEKPKWDYKLGLVMMSFERLYQKTNNPIYSTYVKDYYETVVNPSGEILNYKLEDYNIDSVNAGKVLFDLYNQTKDNRYLIALQTLRKQLETHPRTNSGGFWHKKIYPNQMWLDGLYMGTPFYAQYSSTFNEGKDFDDIAKQFEQVHLHTLDKKTGLLFHAWDESKKMDWANKETGTSPNFWSRSIGWYMMALVDDLDYMPKDHPKRKELIQYLNDISKAVAKYQDQSGLWYQVTDSGKKQGNYLEASGSEMFVYAFAKGVNKGYLPVSYKKLAQKGFDGITKKLITVDADGEIHITQVCASAGLGGNPYRDGSYEYYIKEKIKVDNSHGLGPFILAALELEK
ncbi:glycoside hydrolase family 88 protein [Flavobacterium sp. MC2016-06]|jgi:unsaturated rhamnogalacturonyl hydrolase|uniref:glycoside hydrolase family 88/105 protein n=1 Tax=Flavobacterium sp. MC2016-06 TaxID=2676308 RepID=UPI0012BB1D05|nr:glycoside hydrolase family 88 protein [Flavobacterium sp. MC2016-06]MBU3859682.1 glycoside hydrolase family 88 protein [Flavobacterium sp. MC2016-06]